MQAMEQNGVEPYTVPYMRAKIKDHFKDEVVITNINQKEDIVPLRPSVQSILGDFHPTAGRPGEKKQSVEEKNISILKAALLKSEILAMGVNKGDEYSFLEPCSSLNQTLRHLPMLLWSFLDELFVGKKKLLKIASVGQVIV